MNRLLVTREILSIAKRVILAGKARVSKVATASFNVNSFIAKWERQGLDIWMFEKSRTGYVELAQVIVPKEQRGEGIGTAFMEDLVAKADAANVTLVLTPDTVYGGSSVSRLRAFYKRFGFVDNKGRNKDYAISAAMYRLPRKAREAFADAKMASYLD